MSLDPSTLESDLRKLRPATLDESLLARLEACAGDTWKDLDPAEMAFEKRLRGIAPAPLSASLAASLEATLAGVRFPNDEKIVPFPKPENGRPRRNHGWWGAAAAVALAGVVTALLVPVSQDPGRQSNITPQKHLIQPSSDLEKLVPAGFNRGLSEASDEGVIWKNNSQPHRVLKVVYKDRVTLKDATGRTVEVEQPRVEYILVPAKTD